MRIYLALNIGKSYFLIFSRIRIAFPQLTHLQVSHGSLCRSENWVARFLGILLDERLSFGHHIAMIRVKVSWSLGIIWKLRHTFPGSILKLLFSALSSHIFRIAPLYGCLLFLLYCNHFLSCIIKHGAFREGTRIFYFQPKTNEWFEGYKSIWT